MKYFKYYAWYVFCSWAVFLPIYYILNILVFIKYAITDENGEIRDSIYNQVRKNKQYRVRNNIKGLLDPLE